MKGWIVLAAVVLAGCAAGARGPAVRPAPASPQAPAWSMEGGGPGRVSRTDLAVPRGWDAREMVWLARDTGYRPETHSTPLVIGGVAYVGHEGRSFDAVGLKDGKILWRFATRGRVYTTAAWADGLLLFGDDEGWFYAVDTAGRKAWEFRVPYPVVASPVVEGGRVYLAVSDQNVFCLEASTGRPLWQYGREFPRQRSVWRTTGLAYGDGRVYAGFSDGAVVALDPEDGRVLWRAESGAGTRGFRDVTAGPVYAGGRVYAGSLDGPVVCLDAATGKVLWRADVPAANGFAVGDRVLYLGTAGGSVTALDLRDGSPLWETPLDGGVPTVPVLARNAVVAGASDGSLFALDPATGEVMERYAPGPGLHAQPLVFRGGILFLSDGSVLHWIAGRLGG